MISIRKSFRYFLIIIYIIQKIKNLGWPAFAMLEPEY